MTKFGNAVDVIKAEWGTLSEADRATRLAASVNARLREAGLPSVHIDPRPLGPGSLGNFEYPTWTLVVNKDMLTGNVTDEQVAMLMNTCYHEGRHSEQWFLMARMRAGLGKDKATIMAEMSVTDDFAIEQAVSNPLKQGAPEYPAVESWWESVYGGGFKQRKKILADCKSAASARDAAYQPYIAVYNNTAVPYATRDGLYQAWATANADWENAFRAYRALPEEIDAWGVGDAAEFGYMPTTPVAPPMVPLPLP
jgi:hypothetical protein